MRSRARGIRSLAGTAANKTHRKCNAMSQSHSDRGVEAEEQIRSVPREETTEPPLFRVLLHNDDYTTMEFVVQVLVSLFGKSIEEATRIMLNVHHHGVGLCGLYPYEIAETKVSAVHAAADEHGFPLKCSMEKDLS